MNPRGLCPGTVLANTHSWHGGVRPDEGATGRSLHLFLTGTRPLADLISWEPFDYAATRFDSLVVRIRYVLHQHELGDVSHLPPTPHKNTPEWASMKER
jgi:hypothetical protein